MQQLVLAYVAAFAGIVGYVEAANFERFHHSRCWGMPASAWGVVCSILGPVGAAMLVVAHRRARREIFAATRRSTVVRVPAPDARRRVVASQSGAQPQTRPTQSHVRPRTDPMQVQRVFVYGDRPSPQPSARSASAASPCCAPPGGGTDLLPRREPCPALPWRRIDPRTLLHPRDEIRARVEQLLSEAENRSVSSSSR
jgi:hypothetical protein